MKPGNRALICPNCPNIGLYTNPSLEVKYQLHDPSWGPLMGALDGGPRWGVPTLARRF